MTRILYIGSGAPWSGGAGYLVRQNLFLHALTEVADLHLAMFDAAAAAAPPFPCTFTRLPSPTRAGSSKLKSLLDDLRSPDPRMIRGYDLAPPRQAVAGLHPGDFDAVFAYRIDFAHFAGVLEHPRLILDIDDPEHIRAQRRIAATTGSDGDRRTRRDLGKLRDFELAAVAGAKLAFVCQASDGDAWAKRPVVVPNCVEVIFEPPRRVNEPRVIFVGNCATGIASPNVDAVLHFLADIWPRVLNAVPSAEFHIVGKTGPAVEQAAAKAQHVRLAGFVDDLTETYATASFSVAPIRFGTGTRIKILESFAYACPVVSTVAGADGIDAVPGVEIDLAGDTSEFIRHCIRLLKDAEHRERIGRAGHALAGRLYDRRAQQPRVVAMLKEFFMAHPMPRASARPALTQGGRA